MKVLLSDDPGLVMRELATVKLVHARTGSGAEEPSIFALRFSIVDEQVSGEFHGPEVVILFNALTGMLASAGKKLMEVAIASLDPESEEYGVMIEVHTALSAADRILQCGSLAGLMMIANAIGYDMAQDGGLSPSAVAPDQQN